MKEVGRAPAEKQDAEAEEPECCVDASGKEKAAADAGAVGMGWASARRSLDRLGKRIFDVAMAEDDEGPDSDWQADDISRGGHQGQDGAADA